MKIMVTGAAGFIGSHTVDKLLARGHTVFGVDNLRTGRLTNLVEAGRSSLFHFEEADLTEATTFERLVRMTQPDAIIHLVGLVSVQESLSHPNLNYRLNVHLTHLAAEAARMSGVHRLVYASSAAVYGNVTEQPIRESANKRPLSPYGWAKLASESLLFGAAQSSRLTTLSLRYFNVYGARQDPLSPYSGVLSIFWRQMASNKPLLIFGNGEQTRDFIHVTDVAEANVLAATSEQSESNVLNICTGRAISLNEVVTVFRSFDEGLDVPTQTGTRG